MADKTASSAATVQLQVANRLREALAQGNFLPGEALKIRDLAQEFGTSTQPVRAAIKQLVAEQALQALPNRSARVPLLSAEKLEDLTRVRLAVEGLAVTLAVPRVTPKDIAQLNRLMTLTARNDAQHLANHRNFHFAVYRLAGSTTLMPIIESLWLQLGPYLRQATGEVIGQPLVDQHHVALIHALGRSDNQAARQAIEADILGSAAFSIPSSQQTTAKLPFWPPSAQVAKVPNIALDRDSMINHNQFCDHRFSVI